MHINLYSTSTMGAFLSLRIVHNTLQSKLLLNSSLFYFCIKYCYKNYLCIDYM